MMQLHFPTYMEQLAHPKKSLNIELFKFNRMLGWKIKIWATPILKIYVYSLCSWRLNYLWILCYNKNKHIGQSKNYKFHDTNSWPWFRNSGYSSSPLSVLLLCYHYSIIITISETALKKKYHQFLFPSSLAIK